ncbi:MAG TPA: transcription antitermination factor NusB [Phycisphaerae bacterium]|nr:transcription antitermination factor NusB [Phycisphaerae bacterium]
MDAASRNPENPSAGPAPSARQAALHTLLSLHPESPAGGYAIDRLIDRHALPVRDRALAQELVLGILRHQLTLRHVVAVVSGRRFKDIQPPLGHILLLAAYQLVCLDGIPPFAAVHEAVEQAKRHAGPRAGRFVNAILREVERDIEHRRIPMRQADPMRAVMVDSRQCCQFRRTVLPNPALQAIEHLSLSASHPAWLVSRWVAVFGMDQARRICHAGLCRPPMVLRPNPLRTDLDRLVAALADDGIEVIPDPAAGVLVAAHAAGLTRTAAFKAGLFQVQDRTAMGVVRAMSPRPDQIIIDLCAGPGTKTTQIAEMMRDTGRVLASDKDDERLAMVRDNAGRLGLTSIRTVPPREREAVFSGLDRLDWVLVDTPCSNTGVLSRRPEARYRASDRSLASLTNLQNALLGEAARFARPGTRLAYSTCSIEPEENEETIARFCQAHPEWQLVNSARTMPKAGPEPADWSDGGFWAILQRS